MSLNSHASITTKDSSATSVTLLEANEARRGLHLYNTDANAVYVKFGATATATSFTVKIPADGYWEMPVGFNLPAYTGKIDAIWVAAGSGKMIITER